MGDFADDAVERQMDVDLDRFFAAIRRGRGRTAPLHFSKEWSTWTTKEGEILTITEMDHNHRRNAAAMLLRKNGPEILHHPLYVNLLAGLDPEHPRMVQLAGKLDELEGPTAPPKEMEL